MTLRVMPVLAMCLSAVGAVEAAQPEAKKPRLRAVTVSGGTEEVRVAARTATRLRFDTALDAVRTRLEDDGHGHFEPLLVGNGFLVVTPREALPHGERVPLKVVLSDGTEVPFVLAPSSSEVDVQVRVSRSVRTPSPAPDAREVASLVSEVWAEQLARTRAGFEGERRLFHAGGLSGFVVRVHNPDPLRRWEPGDVRVRHAEGGEEVEVLALRMGPVSLPPGGWGWLVVVTRALPSDGAARFELQPRAAEGVAL
ncbi:DUF2381 family protein [Archangium violaceum]|uniref:DUF2381 family protein n=1 Tax=Archangium violaceum TaxID=83451 RepID=UPI00194FF5DC|nr:DUF2381 family protein [Archangium violaceum]QRN97096.1 DUF2381 family protein [Archangium violaceum]